MIIRKDCNIFDGVADGIIHQTNCFNTMNSGIARQIRERYPEAYNADCKTISGDYKKMGKFSWTKTNDQKFYIYNCYSQYKYGRDTRHTNYEAIYNGLSAIEQHASRNNLRSLSLPHNMGCVLGGGSWHVVNAIIEDIFENKSINLYICRYSSSTI
jgi:O-acetyl-ADP-ribose deacetylase (regulator of RNase III)